MAYRHAGRTMSRLATRRQFLGSAAAPLAAATAARRPNIVVIVTDDQRYDAFSACGRPGPLSFLQTPNMDRLAREGVHFRNTFVTTSLCSPSRASIMSGKYVHTHGVHSLEMDLRDDCRIFPALLRDAGYDTGFVGKWHLGRESDVPDPAFRFWAGFKGQGTYFDPVLNVNGERRKLPGYVTDVLTDQAIGFIQRKRDQPFFLYLGHKAPHSPVTPPKDLAELYTDVDVPLPKTYYENHDDKPAWYLEFHDHDAFHTLLHPVEKYREYVRNYCRTLVSVDRNLGRLLKALDDGGLARDTAVVYLSDNGHFLGEHQFYSKMIMYEESIRIPLLVRYPRQAAAGRRVDEMVLNVDLAPTILDLAGVAAPRDMEGRSFAELIAGRKARDWRQSFLYEYDDGWGLPPLEGVRTADGWQYTRYPDWEQLYDIARDPDQVRNLAADPKYQARKRELIAELKRLGGGRPFTKGPSPYKRQSEPTHTRHSPTFR
jgi:N-acetylglucosamine-6-sulfatase